MKSDIPVNEWSEHDLKRSSTWIKFKDAQGRCLACGEMTDVLCPCCGEKTTFEGSVESADDLWETIENEVLNALEPDWDAIAKDQEIDFPPDRSCE